MRRLRLSDKSRRVRKLESKFGLTGVNPKNTKAASHCRNTGVASVDEFLERHLMLIPVNFTVTTAVSLLSKMVFYTTFK